MSIQDVFINQASIILNISLSYRYKQLSERFCYIKICKFKCRNIWKTYVIHCKCLSTSSVTALPIAQEKILTLDSADIFIECAGGRFCVTSSFSCILQHFCSYR